MHVGLRNMELPSGWVAKKSRSFTAALIGNPDVQGCLCVSVVGDAHWEQEYHEVVVFPGRSAREVSKEGFAGQWETERFYYWNDLRRYIQKACELQCDLDALRRAEVASTD